MKQYMRFFPLVAVLLLAGGCREEEFPVEPTPDPQDPSVISYTVTVTKEAMTKAYLDEGVYHFSAGDELFITGTGAAQGKIYGTLPMTSGAGETTAVFEGDLNCAEGYMPDGATALSCTLIGANGDRLHSRSGSILTTTYPSNEYAADLTEAVAKFSHFTADAYYGDMSLTLHQQSSFLNFSLLFDAYGIPPAEEVTVRVNKEGEEDILVVDVLPFSSHGASQVAFTAALPGEKDLSSASILIEYAGTSYLAEAFADAVTLSPNHYYSVSRSNVDMGWVTLTLPPTADFTTNSQAFPAQVMMDPNPSPEDVWMLRTLSLEVTTPALNIAVIPVDKDEVLSGTVAIDPEDLLVAIKEADGLADADFLTPGDYNFSISANGGEHRKSVATMMLLRSGFDPATIDTHKWGDPVGPCDYVEVKMTMNAATTPTYQNVLGIGNEYSGWDKSGALQFYYPAYGKSPEYNNYGTRNLLMNQGGSIQRSYYSLPDDKDLLVLYIDKEIVKRDGVDFLTDSSASESQRTNFKNHLTSMFNHANFTVGAAEGSVTSKATYSYIRTVKYH